MYMCVYMHLNANSTIHNMLVYISMSLYVCGYTNVLDG